MQPQPQTSRAAYTNILATDKHTTDHATILAALKAILFGNYRDIASRCGLEPPAVGRRTKEMEQRGLIVKAGMRTITSGNYTAEVYCTPEALAAVKAHRKMLDGMW